MTFYKARDVMFETEELGFIKQDESEDFGCADCKKDLTIDTAIADISEGETVEYIADYCLECAKKRGYVENDNWKKIERLSNRS